ncbi:MAG: hypothetical protein R3190_17885 [Thermoanaerobaculia bacterium]|nr:hypothetical protein [Thermoanaerobaculia bacterium]
MTIATARDIVEHCGVARLLFLDFPLGNPCGVPGDVDMQRRIFDLGLDLLESASAPRTTVQAPFTWPGGEAWKEKVLTRDHPFLDESQTESWLAAKADYKKLKAEGKV